MPKTFTRKYNLQIHVERVHEGKMDWLCKHEHCKEKFASKGDMERHYRTHFRNSDDPKYKPFECRRQCGARFSRSEQRDTHGDNCQLAGLTEIPRRSPPSQPVAYLKMSQDPMNQSLSPSSSFSRDSDEDEYDRIGSPDFSSTVSSPALLPIDEWPLAPTVEQLSAMSLNSSLTSPAHDGSASKRPRDQAFFADQAAADVRPVKQPKLSPPLASPPPSPLSSGPSPASSTSPGKKKGGRPPLNKSSPDLNGDTFICYKCEEPKAFTRKYNLQIHVERVHEGKKNWSCEREHCKEKFASKGDMERHYRTHFRNSDDPKYKPFECRHRCATRFSRSEQRDTHEKKCQSSPSN
ncbi:hypothetical protein BGZ83_001697 [Gryganskiella cystojenkinii]|nr:hypothetical protein BGZ83_001697 [Gryganskiella cystojenkinii]